MPACPLFRVLASVAERADKILLLIAVCELCASRSGIISAQGFSILSPKVMRRTPLHDLLIFSTNSFSTAVLLYELDRSHCGGQFELNVYRSISTLSLLKASCEMLSSAKLSKKDS